MGEKEKREKRKEHEEKGKRILNARTQVLVSEKRKRKTPSVPGKVNTIDYVSQCPASLNQSGHNEFSLSRSVDGLTMDSSGFIL